MKIPMSYQGATAALAFAGLIASAAPSFALSGLGCPDLPEYYRAVGTIENGPGSCGMSLAEAKRILAQQSGPADVQQYQPVSPRKRRRPRSADRPS